MDDYPAPLFTLKGSPKPSIGMPLQETAYLGRANSIMNMIMSRIILLLSVSFSLLIVLKFS